MPKKIETLDDLPHVLRATLELARVKPTLTRQQAADVMGVLAPTYHKRVARLLALGLVKNAGSKGRYQTHLTQKDIRLLAEAQPQVRELPPVERDPTPVRLETEAPTSMTDAQKLEEVRLNLGKVQGERDEALARVAELEAKLREMSDSRDEALHQSVELEDIVKGLETERDEATKKAQMLLQEAARHTMGTVVAARQQALHQFAELLATELNLEHTDADAAAMREGWPALFVGDAPQPDALPEYIGCLSAWLYDQIEERRKDERVEDQRVTLLLGAHETGRLLGLFEGAEDFADWLDDDTADTEHGLAAQGLLKVLRRVRALLRLDEAQGVRDAA